MSLRKVRSLVYILIATALISWPVKYFLDHGSFAVVEHRFDLPRFSGRIIAEENIKWGSETRLVVPFEETNEWGDDGILTFEKYGPGITLKAERPDPKTKGFVQHAEKFVWLLGANLFRKITEVSQDGDKLVAVSDADMDMIVPLAFLFSICGLCMIGIFAWRMVSVWRNPESL